MRCPVCGGSGLSCIVGEIFCYRCRGTGEVKNPTNGDLFVRFKEGYPGIPVSDYRPLVYDWIKDMPGILIWTENGDVFAYFPNLVGATEEGCEEQHGY